jgi:hypothetical protein
MIETVILAILTLFFGSYAWSLEVRGIGNFDQIFITMVFICCTIWKICFSDRKR